MMQQERMNIMQKRLLDWYRRSKRDLPWRHTKDPYAISVSEVMLQQTQVDRVKPKYDAWLKAFPTPKKLAAAKTQKILSLWSGLGYNRRALYLRKAAQVVVEKYGGRWPSDPEILRTLPGFGPYTAAAVAIFSTNRRMAAIDTNVSRVIQRVFFGTRIVQPKKLTNQAESVVPNESAVWHHALMDLGATVCISRTPRCGVCPLQNICRAYPKILTQPRPTKKSRQRFTDSDRFWRGNIVRLLTVQETWTREALRRQLSEYGILPKPRFERILAQLAKDGVIIKQANTISLPE